MYVRPTETGTAMHVDAEYSRVLARVGVSVPRSGRPPKGERAGSVLLHIRLPIKVYEALQRRAAKQGTTPTRLVQMYVAKCVLDAGS